MKDKQKNAQEKLGELPTHSMSKSTQDRMHKQIMDALSDVEIQQQKGSRILMKKLQVGVASAAAIVLIGFLGINAVFNSGNQAGEVEPNVEQTPTTNEEKQQDNQAQDQEAKEFTKESKEIEEQVSIETKATEIYHALHNRNMDLLASYVHSEKGLTLSLYYYLDQFSAIFEKNQVKTLLEDDTEYIWGYGEANTELRYTPKGYMDRFLKPDTFLNSNNELFDSRTQRSDLNESIKAAFPNSKIVEYYKASRYEDWKSVYLVFETNDQGIWELVAIVSNEWTP
jgi:hypothetical protein